MRLARNRAAARRVAVFAVVMLLLGGPTLSQVRAQDAGPVNGGAVIASGGEEVLLRESPSYEAMVLAPLADGSALEVTGAPVAAADGASWLPVSAGGQSGFVPAGYVATAPVASSTSAPDAAADPSATTDVAATTDAVAAPPAVGATTTTDANLRAAPNGQSDILAVLPVNTTVSVDGDPVDGFLPVTAGGVSGWMAAELLAQGAVFTTPAADQERAPEPTGSENPSPATAPVEEAAPVATDVPAASDDSPKGKSAKSTGIAWPFAGGQWEVVQGYNNGTHTNRSAFAQYKYALDWARSDGDSAGQPVYAPVAGPIQWVDRGSGGLLIDAGNGYGVALFHITLDRGLSSGDTVGQGERIGRVSGPGDDGYMSMAHVEIDSWRLSGNGDHESAPLAGPNAIAGQEFPDNGGANQYMGFTVRP